jgi:hypothetical protein
MWEPTVLTSSVTCSGPFAEIFADTFEVMRLHAIQFGVLLDERSVARGWEKMEIQS